MMKERVLASVGAASLATIAIAYAASGPLPGTFVLQGGIAKTNGYLNAVQSTGNPSAWKFDFWMTRRNGRTPIAAYDLDMTKLMHVIVVSDDFRTFMHEHPAYSPDGHFKMNQTFPAPGAYHVYFDGRPSGIGQQVFRFDLPAGHAPSKPLRDLSERNAVAHVDGYAVALSGLSLRPGVETSLSIRITKDGRPAADLHPYLHALAHAVFIDADDLSYVHVHPVALGEMSEMGAVTVYSNDTAVVPPNMFVHVTVEEPGTYKLWFQFRGGSSQHVAPFVLTAR